MGPVAGVLGVAVIGVALWDTFETVVLPRRVTRRLRPARLLFKSLWKLWLLVAALIRRPGRRESFLSLFGPFSLIVLLGGWSMMLLLGFALVHSALGLQIAVPERPPTFFTALYLSGTTLFTLGLGDVVPTSAAARAVTVLEAFVGFAFLALVIGYLPVVYQAFSRREAHIAMLDEWAGSPPAASELMRRLGQWRGPGAPGAVPAPMETSAAARVVRHTSLPPLSP